MKTTLKAISCGVLILVFMLAVSVPDHVVHGVPTTTPATRPAGNDLQKLIFVLGAKANEAVNLAAATDAKRIEVRTFELKRQITPRKSVKYSELAYHVSGSTVSRVIASIDVTIQSKKDIRAVFEAVKRAGRIVKPPKDIGKDSKKACVLIERLGKPTIMAIMDTPVVKSTWAVQFVMTKALKKSITKRKAKYGAPSSSPADKTSSTRPTKDPKQGWDIITGIPICLGVHKDRLASGLKAFNLQPEQVWMYDLHLRLANDCVVELRKLFYAIRPDGIVCIAEADVSKNEKDVKKLRRLYEALKNSGKVRSKPRKPPDLLIEVIVPMPRAGKLGRVIVDWGESTIPERGKVYPFSISTSL